MRASLPKLVATIAFSAAAFAVADSYAACLLSLPGQPASNLAVALSALPAWLASGHALSAEAGPIATGVVAACGVWIDLCQYFGHKFLKNQAAFDSLPAACSCAVSSIGSVLSKKPSMASAGIL